MPPAYVKPYVKRQKNDAASTKVAVIALENKIARMVWANDG